MANLFQKGEFSLSSGLKSDFKIECDALTDEDINTLAFIVSRKIKFKRALGVVSGGIKFADALDKYKVDDWNLPTLIADDVLTTGSSMERVRRAISETVIGVVVFARGKCPDWVNPVFQMEIVF
jgi:orotate phosphoribosyltransferase